MNNMHVTRKLFSTADRTLEVDFKVAFHYSSAQAALRPPELHSVFFNGVCKLTLNQPETATIHEEITVVLQLGGDLYKTLYHRLCALCESNTVGKSRLVKLVIIKDALAGWLKNDATRTLECLNNETN